MPYLGLIISEEMHERCSLSSKLLLPRLRDKYIVRSDHIDALHTLGSELVGLVDVARHLVGARGAESARDAHNDV